MATGKQAEKKGKRTRSEAQSRGTGKLEGKAAHYVALHVTYTPAPHTRVWLSRLRTAPQY